MTTSLFTAANAILACPMCMGGADSNAGIAANWAIMVMLVILLFVLGGFLTFIGYLAKRSKTVEVVVGGPPASAN